MFRVFATAALGVALLFDTTARVESCSCGKPAPTLCLDRAQTTLLAHVLTLESSRAPEDDINDDVTFTVQIKTLFKGEPTDDAGVISFITCGNSACCGIDLTVGEEYLLGLYGDGLDGELLYGQSCGLFRNWEDVPQEWQEELVECAVDPCDGACEEYFEECSVYPGGDGDIPYCVEVCVPESCGDEQACSQERVECDIEPCPIVTNCTDVPFPCPEGCGEFEECVLFPDGDYECAIQSCDPDPCAEGETCVLSKSLPPIVECIPPAGECDLECLPSQECLIYTGGDENEPYCADVCDDSTCGDEQSCALVDVTCVREPCPPVAECTDVPLPCPEGCDAPNQCFLFPYGEYQCVLDPCEDPSLCAEGETCTIVETLPPVVECSSPFGECDLECDEPNQCFLFPDGEYQCVLDPCEDSISPCAEGETCAILEIFPPVVECYPSEEECDLECGTSQECLIYTGGDEDEPYCADVCDINTCGDEQSCALVDVTCVREPCPPVAECTDVPCSTGCGEGCYKDSKSDRVLDFGFSSSSMTTETCASYCEGKRAAYSATQFGRECWCYTTGRTDFDRHGDGAVCDYPCAGDEAETCGGYDAFSLHKLDWPAAPTDDDEYVGCYRDTRDDRVMSDKATRGDMTSLACREYCSGEGALFYGTQYGSECWCGTSGDMSDYTKHGEGVCHIPCSGDEAVACGGIWAIDVFEIKQS